MKCVVCQREMHHQYYINVKTGNRFFDVIPEDIEIDVEITDTCRQCELSHISHEYHSYRMVGTDVPPAFKDAFGGK